MSNALGVRFTRMGFSIIVPVKAINDYVRESVPITLALDYEDFEIIILPNETPAESELTPSLRDPRVRIVPTGRVSPAVKRDVGAEQARYEYLAFLDDDAYPRRDWLRAAERAFAEHGVEALGGPGVTPANSSLGEQASGLFYETLVGGGGLAFRYRPIGGAKLVDDFPTVNLIVAKRAFDAVGGFDNEFWPGEDTKLCLDLVKAGYRILYVPELVVWHHRRGLFGPHLRQVGNYGKHRGLFVKRFPETSARPTYFAPSLFLLGNAVLLGAAVFDLRAAALWAVLLSLYFILASLDVFSRTRDVRLGLLTLATIFASHLTYGFMFLRGLLAGRTFQSQLR